MGYFKYNATFKVMYLGRLILGTGCINVNISDEADTKRVYEILHHECLKHSLLHFTRYSQDDVSIKDLQLVLGIF